MVQDARQRTKTYVDTYLDDDNKPLTSVCALTRDDDKTEAPVIVVWGNPDYPILKVFKEKGIYGIISIGEPNSTPMMDPVTQAAYGYNEHVPITTFCIDRKDLTATKFKWKMEAELRRILEGNPTGSLRSLQRRGDKDQRLGSTILYSTEFVLNYRRDTT